MRADGKRSIRGSVDRAGMYMKPGYLLPVRLDDSEVPGLQPSIGYENGRNRDPAQIATAFLAKLGRPGGSDEAIVPDCRPS